MKISETKSDFRFEGWHMLVLMVAFFLVIAAVNFSMAMLANSHWTGLVVKNSYVASQQYNDKLNAAEVVRLSGLRSNLEYKAGMLSFSLYGNDGKARSVDNVVANIGRPAHEHADQSLSFATSISDVYVLPVDLAPGYWTISITGEANGVSYRRDERLFVNIRGEGSIE